MLTDLLPLLTEAAVESASDGSATVRFADGAVGAARVVQTSSAPPPASLARRPPAPSPPAPA